MNLTLKQVSALLMRGQVGAKHCPDHAENDARIARCYGEPAESVAAFRCLNQSGYASLLKRVEAAEEREGYWPPAPSAHPLEAAVERVWRFVSSPEVRIVIAAMAVLLLGMCMADGSWRSMFTPEAGK